MMRKILNILYQPYKWLFFFPFLVLSTLFFGTLIVILAFIINAKVSSAICVVWWARLNSYLTPMLVTVKGRKNMDKNQSYVITSNHQSHYDIFVLAGWLGVDCKWVMKKELRKVPALGIACEKLGYIFIDRSNREAALASLQEAKERVVDGTSVLFFPEGTRSCNGELIKFKKGAFVMAIDLGIPILPITIIDTKKVLPNKTMNLFPGCVKMIIHEPISLDGYSHDNIEELMDRTKSVIQRGLS